MDFVNGFDRVVLDAVVVLHQPWLNGMMENTTLLGSASVLAGVTAAAVLLLLALRRWRTASCLTAAALVCLVCNETVKPLVGRDRPNVSWRFVDLPAQASFPSGHALGSMTVYGTLALTLAVRLRRRTARVLVIAAGVSLALLIGFTRVYLGVHYLSDVLAGWGIGLTLAMLACWVDWRWRRKLAVVALPVEDDPASSDREDPLN